MKKILTSIAFMLYVPFTISMQTQERTYNKQKTDELQKLVTSCWRNFTLTCLAPDITKIEKLVREGADPNIKAQNARGATVLQLAIEYLTLNKKTPGFLELLLQYGARPNLTNNYGESAIDWAITRDARLLRVLIRYKADLHEKDNFGRTPLRLALESKKIVALEILLENGAAQDITADDIQLAHNSKNQQILDLLETYRAAVQKPKQKLK